LGEAVVDLWGKQSTSNLRGFRKYSVLYRIASIFLY